VSIYAFYRACIWLPVLVPTVLFAVVRAFALRPANGIGGEAVLYSLVWGGLPYAVLATWATWWVGGRPEAQIRRLMFLAPPIMVAVFVPLALLVGLAVGAVVPFAGVALLGGIVIMLLGYAYVGLTVLLRLSLGPGDDSA